MFKIISITITLMVLLTWCSQLSNKMQMNWRSMYPTIDDKKIIIYETNYDSIENWDIIVMNRDVWWNNMTYIKRVIWIPWDSIKIYNWDVFIKDTLNNDYIKIEEKYLSADNKGNTDVRWNTEEQFSEVPVESYFVMGDNRPRSTDSRTCFQSCSVGSPYINKSQILWIVSQ
jgi:signal peptidase I